EDDLIGPLCRRSLLIFSKDGKRINYENLNNVTLSEYVEKMISDNLDKETGKGISYYEKGKDAKLFLKNK
ncbi:MAG: hypothetical protein MUE85_15910, partial [Microscillaceae bacterium]|nr:hypothetical protein [Microscillaceae bacterium]